MNATKYILPIVLMSAPAMAQKASMDDVSEVDVLKELENLRKQNQKKKVLAPTATEKKSVATFTASTPKRDNSNDVLRNDITHVIEDLQFARNGVVDLYRRGEIQRKDYDRLVNSLLKTQNTLSYLYPARVFARAAEHEKHLIDILYDARKSCVNLGYGLIDRTRGVNVGDIPSLEDTCAEKVSAYEDALKRYSKRTNPQNVVANTFNERNIFSGSLEAGVDTDDQFYVGFIGGWNFAKIELEKLELLVGGRVYSNGAGDNSSKTITQGNPDGSSSNIDRDVTTTDIDVTGDLRVRYSVGNSDNFYFAPVTGVRGHVAFSNEEIDATSSFTTPRRDVTVIPLNTEENSTVQTGAGFFIGVDGCYSNICVTPEIELQKGGKDIKAGAGVKYQF